MTKGKKTGVSIYALHSVAKTLTTAMEDATTHRGKETEMEG